MVVSLPQQFLNHNSDTSQKVLKYLCGTNVFSYVTIHSADGGEQSGFEERLLDTPAPDTPRMGGMLRSNSQSSLASTGLTDNPQEVECT